MIENLNQNERKLLSIFLDYLSDKLANNGCNDLTDEMKECLTSEEWDSLNKFFHEQNGDPEEYHPGQSMQDYSVLYALTKKLGL